MNTEMKPDLANDGEETGVRPNRENPYLKGLVVVGITSSYIFGPMLVIGGIGYWLTQRYDNKLFVFGALLIALVVSNILIFKNTNSIVRRISEKK